MALDSGATVELDADDPVVAASVLKVPIAVEFLPTGGRRPARPDRADPPAARDWTPGPTGISTFDDEVQLSLRDLLRMMLIVSDNAATDEVLGGGGQRDDGRVRAHRYGHPGSLRGTTARQATRHRIAVGFPYDVSVAAKAGSLIGVIRNEVAVVSYPDEGRYTVAVFTQANRPFERDHEINEAIGVAAAEAVRELRAP
jgi:beta-lactamase class A